MPEITVSSKHTGVGIYGWQGEVRRTLLSGTDLAGLLRAVADRIEQSKEHMVLDVVFAEDGNNDVWTAGIYDIALK